MSRPLGIHRPVLFGHAAGNADSQSPELAKHTRENSCGMTPVAFEATAAFVCPFAGTVSHARLELQGHRWSGAPPVASRCSVSAAAVQQCRLAVVETIARSKAQQHTEGPIRLTPSRSAVIKRRYTESLTDSWIATRHECSQVPILGPEKNVSHIDVTRICSLKSSRSLRRIHWWRTLLPRLLRLPATPGRPRTNESCPCVPC
jgi:hypothetical protein